MYTPGSGGTMHLNFQHRYTEVVSLPKIIIPMRIFEWESVGDPTGSLAP